MTVTVLCWAMHCQRVMGRVVWCGVCNDDENENECTSWCVCAHSLCSLNPTHSLTL